MKLRIRANSIRLRLGQSEVRRLASEGIIEESTVFGPGPQQRLVYALCAYAEEETVTATFAGQCMVVRIPLEMAHLWATTDEVSIRALQRVPDCEELRILIEKDFECIVVPASDESQEDAFPNPQLGCVTH